MIRILIADADPMIRGILRELVQRVYECVVLEEMEDLSELETHEVDLIVGEVSFRGELIIPWIQKCRKAGQSVDFLPITGCTEYKIYHMCAENGAVDYILKPFDKKRVKNALIRYNKWKQTLLPDTSIKQTDLDAFYYPGILMEEPGIGKLTYKRIETYICTHKCGWFTAREAALEMKISLVTMRRYLEYMGRIGFLNIQLQYGKRGRPINQYCINTGRNRYGDDDRSYAESRETARIQGNFS